MCKRGFGMANSAAINRAKRLAALLLACVLAMAFALPSVAYAQDSGSVSASQVAASAASAEASELVADPASPEAAQKTVRVGWFESPFNIMDQFGRRSGYAYEYQRKIAAYTGWNYEYVKGSWSELVQKLKDGEIDLMSDVSFKEERTKDMFFSSLPMGTETYYVFVSPDNTEITALDFSTLNGKTVGVTKDSIQRDLFLEWEKNHGVKANLVELTGAENESLGMLKTGELDAFITLDSYDDFEKVVPISKIGSSDFFFVVGKDNAELLDELDAAMGRIQEENRFYNQQLHEKYLRNAETDRYLNTDELKWLSSHGTIRVGYQDNYLAFCAADEKTGELTGALKDFLAYASNGLENATLHFEAVAYPTAAAAMEALKKGEVDCMFPANLSDYDGEELGVVVTPPLMRTEMDAVVREADQKEFIRKDDVVVAVNEGNTNYEMFLVDYYPGWQTAHFPDTPAGLEAVAAGKADCVIISNYRYSNISKQCEKLHLTTVYTGVDMDYCLAVREGDSQLYSILARIANTVPSSTINAALTYYSTEDVRVDFGDLIKDNLFIVMTVVAVVLLVILLLLLRSIRAERKAREEESLVNDLSKRVYVDALTSVRNKGAFDQYVQDIQERIDRGEQADFAVGVFDCDNLKEINDQLGHEQGDKYLKTASHLICQTFQHSPVFRIGGDEFAAILQNEDFENRDALASQFEAAQAQFSAISDGKWEGARVALGIAVHDNTGEDTASDTVRRADKAMYENKRLGKSKK